MTKRIILGSFLALSLPLAYADTADVSIVNTVTASIAAAATQILPQALIWLGSFMALQFVLTNFSLLKSGADTEAIFGKLIGSLAWFSFCIYLINNGPEFIDSVGNGILNKFAPNIPGPGTIITATLSLCTAILIGIGALGTSVVGIGNSSLAMVLVYVLFLVFSIGMYMAIKVFMLTLELGLVVMLSPLSFSFLGLNALKDQGIAPLKSLIALVYRIVLLGIVYAAFGEVISVAGQQLDAISWKPWNFAKAVNIIFSLICAFPMLAYLVYKSDSIAASLAGGSSNMGTGDIASAAAFGAAAGAAIGSGAGTATNAASKIPESMSSFMKGLAGGGGSVSDASTRGAGASPVGTAPIRPATPSSAYPTRKDGSPIAAANTSTPGAKAGPSPDGASPSSPPGSAGASGPSTTDTKTAQDFAKAPEPTAPQTSTGSGSSASIGGPGESSRANMDDVLKAVGQIGQGNKKSTVDHLASANQQIAQESAATHVSINTHQSD